MCTYSNIYNVVREEHARVVLEPSMRHARASAPARARPPHVRARPPRARASSVRIYAARPPLHVSNVHCMKAGNIRFGC